jgi:hypothetical protein
MLMLTGVITNFNQILLVLQGNITSYIGAMFQQVGILSITQPRPKKITKKSSPMIPF